MLVMQKIDLFLQISVSNGLVLLIFVFPSNARQRER